VRDQGEVRKEGTERKRGEDISLIAKDKMNNTELILQTMT
jgi:hypothetical protein